jgi:hypothetical protein
MDMIKVQAIADDFIPEIRKELINDVQAAVSQFKVTSQLSTDDLPCLLELVADAALKASAKLLVETLGKIL